MSGEEFAGTMPVADRLRFDEAALEGYLRAQLPGFVPPLRVEQFRGGQSNPTFLLTAGDGAQLVLRKKPAGTLLPSAHAIDREFRVIRALHGSAVPVARPLCLCADEAVIGTMFYVMEYAAGRAFWDPTLPGLSAPERAALYDEMNRVMVALHTLDYAAAGLADYGKPGNYVARQIARWSRQYRASYHVMLWRVEHGEIRGLRGIDHAALGIPTEAEYVAAYCRRSGRAGIEPRVWEFCMAYNLFRIASIRQGIMKRVLEGTAGSGHARESGERARETAELAWRQVEEHLGA